MKKLVLAATMLAVVSISLVSCDFLFGKKASVKTNPFIGNWRIDSLDFAKDSGNKSVNYLGFILLAATKKDSAVLQYNFVKDSTTFYFTKNDSVKLAYAFDDNKKEITIYDSVPNICSYKVLSDSAISIMDKDSITLFLKKL